MKKSSKIVIVLLILAVFLLENGSVIATVNPNQTEFKVIFSGKPSVSNENTVKASITNEVNASVSVSGLTMKENVEYVTYIVQNTSKNLYADLVVNITNSNKEFFDVKTTVEKNNLTNGEATKITIKIELIKEPIDKSEMTTIGIQLRATPVQPENENGSGTNNSENFSTVSTSNGYKTTNSDSEQYDYYEKDVTPKTGC